MQVQPVLDDASCLACLPAGELELVKTVLLMRTAAALNPGMSTNVQAILDEAACLACLPGGMLQIVQTQLLANIASGISGAGGLSCGTVDPVAAPSGSCGLYVNTSNGQIWIWDGAAWQLKV